MIQALADRMAEYIVKNDDTANHELLAYGFELILYGAATYTIVIASSFIFGVVKEMLIAIWVYLSMRYIIGGVHANSRIVCFITYAGTMYLCICLSKVLNLTGFAIAVFYVIDLFLLLFYAPSDTVEQPIVNKRLLRKILGIALLSLYFILSAFNYDMRVEANLLILVSTLTCIFQHPLIYKMYGCRKSGGII